MKAQFTKILVQMSCACLLMAAVSTVHAAGTVDAPKPSGMTITGTITGIDPDNATITVTPANGGTASVVTLTTSTVLIGHETISGSAIALGDTLEVNGVPLALQVTSIADNHVKSSTPASTAATANSPAVSPASSTTSAVAGSIQVKGVVTSLQPATIKVSDTLSLTLVVTTSTTLSELITITASQLAVGDTVTAQTGSSNGTLTAAKLDVTAPAS
ncbi:MAG: hypothetical protein ACRYFS_07570 [Janthinobacterium lividum]